MQGQRDLQEQSQALAEDLSPAEAQGAEQQQRRRARHDGLDDEVEGHPAAHPEHAPLGLPEEVPRVAGRSSASQRGRDEERLAKGPRPVAEEQHEPRQGGHESERHDAVGAADQPRGPVRIAQQVPEALGTLEVRHQQPAREREEDERHEDRHPARGRYEIRLAREQGRGEGRRERAARNGLGPQVARDLRAPQQLAGDVIDRSRLGLLAGSAERLGIEALAGRVLGPDEALGEVGLTGVDAGRSDLAVEDIGARAGLGLAGHEVVLATHPRDHAVRIIEVPRDDRLGRADHRARRREAHLRAVRAEVALLRRPRVRVDVEGVVGAPLHARLAPDAAVGIHIHDAIGTLAKSARGADLDAGGLSALVTAQDREAAANLWELADLGVLHPGPKAPQGDIVLRLAGDRARVASDAARVVNDESKLHGQSLRGRRF